MPVVGCSARVAAVWVLAFHTSAGSQVASHSAVNVGTRVPEFSKWRGAAHAGVSSFVPSRLLCSCRRSLPSPPCSPSCLCALRCQFEAMQTLNAGALTMRPHSSCLVMCWRSLCWTSHSLRLRHQRCRWMEEEKPRGEEQRDTHAHACRRTSLERWA